ncbi:hypothetical protein HanIR_Chr13g0653391 [Helianthus annuus]|nr:hypothetical protein HanIR_Chr13g0653391 [Helianthus annuus]
MKEKEERGATSIAAYISKKKNKDKEEAGIYRRRRRRRRIKIRKKKNFRVFNLWVWAGFVFWFYGLVLFF